MAAVAASVGFEGLANGTIIGDSKESDIGDNVAFHQGDTAEPLGSSAAEITTLFATPGIFTI